MGIGYAFNSLTCAIFMYVDHMEMTMHCEKYQCGQEHLQLFLENREPTGDSKMKSLVSKAMTLAPWSCEGRCP